MKICIVTCQYSRIWSGVGTYARNLINGLADLDHEVTVICPPGQRQAAHPHVRIVDPPSISVAPTLQNWPLLGWQFRGALKRLLASETFDLIHFCDARESLFFTDTTTPVLGAMHDYYFIERKIGLAHYLKNYSDGIKRWGFYNLSHWIERIALRRLDHVIANTDYVKNALRKSYDVAEQKLSRVYYGLHTPPPPAAADKTAKQLPGQPSLLFVGSNFQRKGLPCLMTAVSQLLEEMPAIRLYVVGEDAKQQAMLNLASSLGVAEHIEFMGGLDNEVVTSLYPCADIFAMPSLIEGFGIVFLEAMAAGTNVIGGNCGGTPELIHDGVNGFVADPENPEQLAENIRQLVQNPQLAEELRQNARHSYDQYPVGKMLDETLAVYRKLIN